MGSCCRCWRPSPPTHFTPPDSPAQLGWQAGYGKSLVLQTVGLAGAEQAAAASSASSSSGGIALWLMHSSVAAYAQLRYIIYGLAMGGIALGH